MKLKIEVNDEQTFNRVNELMADKLNYMFHETYMYICSKILTTLGFTNIFPHETMTAFDATYKNIRYYKLFVPSTIESINISDDGVLMVLYLDYENCVVQSVITFAEAVKVVIDEIKSDEELWFAYQSNIAMAFYDNYRWFIEKNSMRTPDSDEMNIIHSIANKAAIHFLDVWCDNNFKKTKEYINNLKEEFNEIAKPSPKYKCNNCKDTGMVMTIVNHGCYADEELVECWCQK
jgi:hypothetical protein